jgi:hypothetical protein
MGTPTDIQYLGAVGDPTAGNDAGQSYRTQVETFIAGGTIGAADLVAFDSSKTGHERVLYVVEAGAVATVGNPGVIGVALNAASAGETVQVVVAGYCASANVDGATVAGSALIGPIGTAGRAAIEAPGTTTGAVWGVALAADSANLAPVVVFKRF